MSRLLKLNVHNISYAKFQIGLEGHKISELVAMAMQAEQTTLFSSRLSA